MKTLYEYVGCIHAHSLYSDGSGTYPKIIRSAQEAGLDFLLMSDHMTLKGRDEGYNGWHDHLFVGIGYEINDTADRHHYLAFGLDETLPANLNHEDYIRIVKEKNVLGIAAHPFEERDVKSAIPGFPAITWSNLDYPEIEVIELWNMMSHWLELTTLKNIIWNIAHPRSFSTFPSQKLLEWWDNTSLSRKVTAVGSVDVHATKFKILGFIPKAVFDYKVMFKSIRTHLLSEVKLKKDQPPDEVERILYKLIYQGCSFISNYRRGDARGFRFWAENGGKVIQMGETGNWKSGTLQAILPEKAFCTLYQNGRIINQESTNHLKINVGEGIYRLVVEKDQRGWIYTNHIKIKG